MRDTLTISISPGMRQQLARAAKADGVTTSAFVRKALKTELFRKLFRTARAELLPKARAENVCTDKDVFKIVS